MVRGRRDNWARSADVAREGVHNGSLTRTSGRTGLIREACTCAPTGPFGDSPYPPATDGIIWISAPARSLVSLPWSWRHSSPSMKKLT
ncbi:hypothetical protein GCM10010171_54310 [Actinokineospora fastidiosa]|uniref:Uncharacterized protein n=1 Tax=Actinokineospora fastidiosa TaxID=1816 RepID=A0A918GR32_9PSEU|nr:hypothetical protein GCM10010171_54310 [Actinokineospora fastidiosa]